MRQKFGSLALIGILAFFALACASGDDAPIASLVSVDATGKPVPASIRNSFKTILAGEMTLGANTQGPGWTTTTPDATGTVMTTAENVRGVRLASFQLMDQEVSVGMYVDYLNSPIIEGSQYGDPDSPNPRGEFFRTQMESDLFAGIFRTDPQGGVVVSQIDNVIRTSGEGEGDFETLKSEIPMTVGMDPFAQSPSSFFGSRGIDENTTIIYHSVPGREDYPMTFINKTFAFAFADWLGKAYRLPTEDEWEYAAKGGVETSEFPTPAFTGFTLNASNPAVVNENPTFIRRSMHGSANFQGNHEDFLAPTKVKSYPANPYGLHDMAGNVYEWTILTVGDSALNDSFVKGGSWNTNALNDLAVWSRFGPINADAVFSDVGFRLVFYKGNFDTVTDVP